MEEQHNILAPSEQRIVDGVVAALEPRFLEIDRRFESIDSRLDHIDSRFDHVDSELLAIKLKINELIEVTGEGGMQGKKVLPFPITIPDAEEE